MAVFDVSCFLLLENRLFAFELHIRVYSIPGVLNECIPSPMSISALHPLAVVV